MRRMKRILPSLRQKKRYLVFEIVSNKKINNFQAVSKAVHKKTSDLLGELGMAKAGILMPEEKWNPKKQRGIIKVNNSYINHLKSALLMVEKIGNQNTILKSVGISGVLRKAEQKYMVM